MAKRFFLVCAGMFLLALAYHLGAESATAQGAATGSQLDGANIDSEYALFSGAVGRTVFIMQGPGPGVGLAYVSPVPGTDPVASTAAGLVLLTNGDAYRWSGGDPTLGQWVYVGNLTGGPTSAKRQSWGSVKAQYR